MNFTRAKLNDLKILPLLFLVLALTVSSSFAQKSANKGGGNESANKGGSNGGGTTPAPTPAPTPPQTNPLPQTAPAPDVIYRESFGAADLYRPTGSKGTFKDTYVSTPLNSFWIEYPGSKNTAWIAPAEGQTWRLCGASNNPYEMYSPIQMTLGNYGNGCVISKWTDNPTQNPTALMPFNAPTTSAYEVSINGYPAPIAGKYLALGLTNSAATYSNLENSGDVVLFLKPAPPYANWTLSYELRVGGINGTLLASGETYSGGFNQLSLRYDPVTKTISSNVNGTALGTYSLDLGSPRYAAFEGVALADNFVIKNLQ